MKCILDPEYNHCEFFLPETRECLKQCQCLMQENRFEQSPPAVNETERQEKWFEKYYK